jgi:hypothetical protein
MTRTVSDVICPFRGLAGTVVEPYENILNEGEYLSWRSRCVKKFTEAKNYPVICSHCTIWDKMEVKNVSS